jgi:ligand-binding sensor domain-containing protein
VEKKPLASTRFLRLLSGWCLVFLGTILGPGLLSAQNVLDAFTPYVHGGDMRDLAYDGDGSLWIASDGGALRFDVSSEAWTIYPRLLGTGPRGNDLVTLCIDFQDRVWTGSATRGFAFYDPGTGTWDRDADEWPDPAIRIIRCFGQGVYIGTQNGLSLKPTPNRTDICADSDPSCIVPSFVVNDYALLGDDLWVATEGGLGRFNGTTWDSASALPAGSVGQKSRSLAVFDGDLWEASDVGIRRLTGAAWDTFSVSATRLVLDDGDLYALPGNERLLRFDGSAFVDMNVPLGAGWKIRDIEKIGSDIYLATGFGLVRWDGAAAVPQFVPPTPPVAGVFSGAAVDVEGNVWFGTSEQGNALVRGTGSRWDGFFPGGGLVNQWILALFSSRRGGLWIGHCCCPVPASCPQQIFENGSFTTLDGRYNAIALTEDPQGRIWSGYRGAGISIYEKTNETWTPLFDVNTGNNSAMPSNNVEELLVTADGTYIGYQTAGLDYWPHGGDLVAGRAGSNWIHYGTDFFGLLDTNVGGMAQVGQDVWVSTSGGLHRFRAGVLQERCPTIDRSAIDDHIHKVNVLVVDNLGNLWAGTNTGILLLPRGGLCDGIGGEFQEFSVDNSPLPDNRVVSGVLNPRDGAVWFGTAKGLLRIDPLVYSGSAPPPDEYVLYPNPLDLSPNTTLSQRRVYLGIEVAGLRVDPVPATDVSKPEVFDIVGHPVGAFDLDNTVPGGAWVWTGKNRNGDYVAPGLYVVRSREKGGKVILRKVGVVR